MNDVRMNDPGLAADFRCCPPEFVCREGSGHSKHKDPQQPSLFEETAAPSKPGCIRGEDDESHAKPNHEPEARGCRRHRWSVLRTNTIESENFGIAIAVQQEA